MEFLKDKKNLYFTVMYISLLAFIMCAAADLGIWAAVFRVLTIPLFALFLFMGNTEGDKARTADFEKTVMVLFVLLFNIFMLYRGKMQGRYETLNSVCGWLLIAVCAAYIVFCHAEVPFKKWFLENKFILLILLSFVLLSIEVIDICPMWDTQQYYRSLEGMARSFNADFLGIYGLGMCGHVSQGYSLWLIFFQLFKKGFAAVQIADIVLAGISIFAYYQILRKLLGKKYNNNILALATVPYAVSPFVMGMVESLSLDGAAMYFAIIFIACSLHKQERLEMFLAAFLCFTKEPSVVCYFVYIVTKIICEYLAENRFNLLKLMRFGFGNVKNYVYALPAALWYALYKLNINRGGGGWAGVNLFEENIINAGQSSGGEQNAIRFNCFGIDSAVVFAKFKQIFLLNFNWIFWVSIIAGIIILCVKKDKLEKEIKTILIPLGAFAAAAAAIGCLYITYVLPRYILPVIPVIYLIAVGIIGDIIKDKIFYIWNIAVSVLLLAQCFYGFDPVMAVAFPARQTGDGYSDVMYDTGNHQRFDDHIVYNRQNIHWPAAMKKIFDSVGYDGDMLIAVPTKLNSQYELLGAAVWNKQRRKLECYGDNQDLPEEYARIISCKTANMTKAIVSSGFNRVLYVIPKWDVKDESVISGTGLLTKDIIKQGKVDYKGFTVEYYAMDVQFNFPLADGSYLISPKQDSSLRLYIDGNEQIPHLTEENNTVKLSAVQIGYELMFENSQTALDIAYGEMDGENVIWAYGVNNTSEQKWWLEEKGGYYMICWDEYVLEYDLESGLAGLAQKTGEDNQLWSFTQ